MADGPGRPNAPGQLPSHYAPRTPLYLTTDTVPTEAGRLGFLAFRQPADKMPFAATEVLSPNGDLRQAAANLFAALHRLDAMELDAILAEPLPQHGLGVAVNDRLRRAAATTTANPLRPQH
jgi:L-threonylcarbamoyladenylate synthase